MSLIQTLIMNISMVAPMDMLATIIIPRRPAGSPVHLSHQDGMRSVSESLMGNWQCVLQNAHGSRARVTPGAEGIEHHALSPLHVAGAFRALLWGTARK